MSISLSLVIGLSGMVLILGAFILVGNHRLSPDDLLYDVMNAVGSLLLVINAIMTGAWPFLVLNTVWGIYAFRDVLRRMRSDIVRHTSISKDLLSPLVHKHAMLRQR